MTKVCAITPYACALACVESILKDQGIELTQQQMLDGFAEHFPRWSEHPGILEGKDYEPLFKLAGLSVTLCLPKTFAETITMMRDNSIVGVILGTSRFWKGASKTELIDCWHALRIFGADELGITAMNPVVWPGPVTVETYRWEEIERFETQPLALRKITTHV
ncbi:MAG TPA: hypothetical protein VGE29_10590 [Prosthecobacter sp.]